MKLQKNTASILLLIILSILAYFPIFSNGFVWDDEKFIVDRPQTRQLSTTLESFSEHEYGIYRPVRTLAYYFAFAAFRLDPFWYHVLSIVFHSGACILIYYILKTLFDRKLALLSGILFAVHPLHIGRVANATGSFDLIGILFLLSSFYCYLLYRKKNLSALLYGSLGLFIIGLFSSEEIFTLPFLILLYEFVFGKKQWKSSLPYFGLLALFLMLRVGILSIGERVTEYPGGSIIVTLLSMPKVLIQYFLLMFFPVGLSPFREFTFVRSAFDLWFILPVIVLIGIVYFGYRFRKNKHILFSLGWIAITLLPFYNITPLQKIMAERYFYVASLGVILLCAYGFSLLEKKWGKKVLYAFAIAALCLLSLTVHNSLFWKDNHTLMSRGIELNPADSKAHNNLGTYYYQQGNFQQALIHFKAATDNDPQNFKAWTNLGTLYSASNQFQQALSAFENALKITPYNYEALDKVGVVYLKNNNFDKAKEYFDRALHFKEDYAPALSHLGTLYGRADDASTAASYFKRAIEANPYYAEAYYNMGLLHQSLGNTAEAETFIRRAKQLDPSYE